MKALALRTRCRDESTVGDVSLLVDGEACLLVYDSATLSSSTVSEDVRDILIFRPNTPWIYVLCPFLSNESTMLLLEDGFASERAGTRISVIQLEKESNKLKAVSTRQDGAVNDLNPELIHGWLFDLFDSHHGLVRAPAGVHFTKLSKRHTDRFLRTSNALLSSRAVGAVAFFALLSVGKVAVKRIFVDTAPLIGVAFALSRIARVHNLSGVDPEVESFSSYGGISNLPPIGVSDLFILSASTSGSLAQELVDRGAEKNMTITLFYLGAPAKGVDAVAVVCDLTHKLGRDFGYEPVLNADPKKSCELCDQGLMAVPLEGDQFILEKRATVRMRVSIASQTKQARDAAENLSKKKMWLVDTAANSQRNSLRLDLDSGIPRNDWLADSVVRLIQRFTPIPLDTVVLVGVSVPLYEYLLGRAGLRESWRDVTVLRYEKLASASVKNRGRVLVLIGYLDDHALVRSVNAQMRVKVPHGDVAYLSMLSVADSAQNMRELEMFLSYGARGADTFTFRTAVSLMLPRPDVAISPWIIELDLLRRKLAQRLHVLEGPSARYDQLFLDGKNGPLAIAADFVYLDTKNEVECVTQADVFAVVSNLLATARCDDTGLLTPQGKQPGSVKKSQSIYGQVVVNPASLCPRNLRDYNDAILRAAFLRGAYQQELNYSVDEQCSTEVLDILKAESDGWDGGYGDSLPEMLIAIATGRLKLYEDHLAQFIKHCRNAVKDEWAIQLLDEIAQGTA
jgi:hypothetical protein